MKDHRAEQVAELVQEYGRMVYTTAYRILGSAQDAEDALQEVFLKVHCSWDGKTNPNRIQDWGAFLKVAASNRAVDLLRRNRTRIKDRTRRIQQLESDPQGEANTTSAPPADPRQAAIQRQQAELLRSALSTLPRREARIFALRHFEDFSYEQIAEQLRLKTSAVGVILHRAHKRLRQILEPCLSMDSNLTHAQRKDGPMEAEKRHVTE